MTEAVKREPVDPLKKTVIRISVITPRYDAFDIFKVFPRFLDRKNDLAWFLKPGKPENDREFIF